MTEPSPAKPGTACIGCRRRKLKCSRESTGCSNCSKADLPCVYPAPETGVKRKRGPYKKDKPPRERHLEDLVKYLEPKPTPGTDHLPNEHSSPSNLSAGTPDPSRSVKAGITAGLRGSNSEDLVKDALIALTKSTVSDRDSGGENGPPQSQTTVSTTTAGTGGNGHPAVRRIFEYWHLFVTRMDPMLKIIHCPSFARKLFAAIDNLEAVDPVMESLMYSVYHAAVSSCTPREARKRFGENRDVLLQRYARVIESTLADNYSMPSLESVQALVLYLVCIKRDDSTASVRALFSLAVRMAQLIGIHEDPGDNFPAYEAEYRRRLWWHLCGTESRGAEEGAAKQTSIMEDRNVKVPANFNDYDLDPDSTDLVQPRSGVTEMTYCLVRWEIIQLVYRIMAIKKAHKIAGRDDPEALKSEQNKVLEEGKLRCETHYLRFLHPSRPYDWLCIGWTEAMLIKCRIAVDFPVSQIPTKEMSPRERFELLQMSVDIIRLTQAVVTNPKTQQWAWYFRGWVQWHSLAIVIADLGGNTNQQFVNAAWAVLDPVLQDWDKVYQSKRDEAAWEHVNTLIQRARQMRKHFPVPRPEQQKTRTVNVPSAPPQVSAPNPSISSGAGFDTTQPQMGGMWQTPWLGFDATQPVMPSTPNPTFGQQQFPSPPSTEVPFVTGCAPTMLGMDGDFGYIEGLDSIDFSAFDAVFGDTAWDSSTSTDLNFDGLGGEL